MVDVDRAMWDWNPRTASNHRGMFYKNPVTHNDFGGQTIVRTLVTADHEGMMQWIKDFMQPPPGGGSSYSGNGAFFYNGADFLDKEVFDSAIPNTPVITYKGSTDFPINNLTFQTSSFSDPQGSQTFATMKWRIAEDGPGQYEINALWESEEITQFSSTKIISASVVQPGRTYRVRCRMKDNTGRWSHWSDPVQFIAGEPDGSLNDGGNWRTSTYIGGSPGQDDP